MNAIQRRVFSGVLLFVAVAAVAATSRGAADPYLGRWDLTITQGDAKRPSWLEIEEKNGAVTGRFVGTGGSAGPVADLRIEGGRLIFSTGNMELRLAARGKRISGTISRANETLEVSGRRAPRLAPRGKPRWGAPIQLFSGKNLAGWRLINPAASNWIVKDGALLNTGRGSNIATEQKFDDFQLHIEFNCPPGCNSGVYLRGRYEVQVEDNEMNAPPTSRLGGVYGFLAPEVEMPRRPGEWQSFDITLRGRLVTILQNGRTIVRDREIPGITGGALDSDEGQPGPVYLQGDHGGLAFRNIVLRPGRR